MTKFPNLNFHDHHHDTMQPQQVPWKNHRSSPFLLLSLSLLLYYVRDFFSFFSSSTVVHLPLSFVRRNVTVHPTQHVVVTLLRHASHHHLSWVVLEILHGRVYLSLCLLITNVLGHHFGKEWYWERSAPVLYAFCWQAQLLSRVI